MVAGALDVITRAKPQVAPIAGVDSSVRATDRGPKSSGLTEVSAVAKRSDAWRVLGPGGGGAQFAPSVNPRDPNMVLVACDMGGSYISIDGGISWRMFNLGARVKAFAFDPGNPRTIYALAGELWRSEDAGTAWKLVYPKPSEIINVNYSDDEASRLILTRLGVSDAVTALAVDPQDSSVLFGVFGRTVKVSKDRGVSWTVIGAFSVGNGLKLYIDPRSPKNQRTVYVITTDRICVLENWTYHCKTPPQESAWFSDAAAGFSPDRATPVIYVAFEHRFEGSTPIVKGGLLRSNDGGSTWTRADESIIRSVVNIWILPEYSAVNVASDDPNRVYLSYSRLRLSSRGPDFFGIAQSNDGGSTWSYPWKEAGLPAANIHDSWVSERFGPYWGENPLGIALVAAKPNVIFTTDLGRTMRSIDNGATWQAMYSKKLQDGSYTTTGLDVTAETGLYFDPFDNNRMFLAHCDISLFRSDNGGVGWVSSSTGIEKNWLNTAYAVAFDPDVRGRMWTAVSNKHGIPSWFDVRSGMAGFKGGIAFSNDGGMNWSKSNRGMPEMAATDVILDSSSPVNRRILYAAGYGVGIFKSIDSGQSWTLTNKGIIGATPAVWRIVRDQEGGLYVVIARRSIDGTYGNDTDGAIYRSIDGAAEWTRVTLPPGVNGPMGLSVDPRDVNRLYLCSWPRGPQYGVGKQGGVYLSTDRGLTWKYVFSDNQYIWDITIDPANPDVVYAAGLQSSIWRSNNRGETWNRIKGFNYKRAYKVVPDPRDRSKIFVVTGGGGLWHGPAAGDPLATEDMGAQELPRYIATKPDRNQ